MIAITLIMDVLFIYSVIYLKRVFVRDNSKVIF
jgi:hypothetical protein